MNLGRKRKLMLAPNRLKMRAVLCPFNFVFGASYMFENGRAKDYIELFIREWQGFVITGQLHGLIPVFLSREFEIIFQDIGNDDFPVVRENGIEMISRTTAEIKDAILRLYRDMLGQQYCPLGSRSR